MTVRRELHTNSASNSIPVVVIAICAGCGSVSTMAMDASGQDAVPDAAPRCDPGAPFGSPTLVPNINSESQEQGARLSPDELVIYFASDRPGGPGSYDIYVASRDSVKDAFGQPTIVPVSTANSEGGPMPTDDGLGLYFMMRPSGGWSDVYFSSRSDLQTEFGAPSGVASINTEYEETEPYVSHGDGAMYFPSTRGADGYQMYRAPRVGEGFGLPSPLAELNAAPLSAYPVPAADDLQIFWGSSRLDGDAEGGLDIWEAHRSSADALFGTVTRNADLSTDADEAPTWLSLDNCVLYFLSNRPGGRGGVDIYVVQRGR